MHVSWAGSHWHLAGRSWVNCQTSFKYKEFSGPKCLSAEPEKLFNPPNNSLKKLSHWAINLPKESAANTMLNYTMTTVQSNKQVELNISDIKYMCFFFFFSPLHIWVPSNPIQFWHYLESMQTSQVKGSAPKNVSHFGHHTQVWASWTNQSGSSQDPLLRFYDLLNWLIRLRKALYLQPLVYFNEYSWETAKWKRCTG